MKIRMNNNGRSFSLKIAKSLLIGAMLGVSVNALAVTEADMDQARAIAAKFYVRYINDGSGYLDHWLPGSMSDIEKKVANATDKENLKKFKSASYPKDYASWDKEKLAAYWGEQFFSDNASALDSKAAANAMCRKQIKKAVQDMKLETPAPAAAPTPAPAPAPEEPAQPAPVAEEAPVVAEDFDEGMIEDSMAMVGAEILNAEDQASTDGSLEGEGSSDSGTWVYIMVLGILVAVVIALVIFASRTMKNQAKKPKEVDVDADEEAIEKLQYEPEVTAAPVVAERQVAEETRMREKYARNLAAKSEEIRALTRQLADMEALAANLREENRRLGAELEKLRSSRSVTPASARAEAPVAPIAASVAPAGRNEEKPRRQHHSGNQHGPATTPREIYLGRVNSRGLFVRADRHAVDGQSIYKLTTTNGVNGTYTLIKNPLITDQVLEDPGKWLAGGCFAKDIFDTAGREDIYTETPGTAVFADGAWRVERKAKIRYE